VINVLDIQYRSLNMPPSPKPKKIQSRVKWEIFADPSFYDMWAVRPTGDHAFNSPRLFHFMDLTDAAAFKVLLDKSYHAVTGK
jgi:hypothetical protein